MMKAEESIFDQLRRLDRAHRSDGDGGYELVRAIRVYAQSLDPENREALWGVLFRLVEQQDATLWGVALEALIQENPQNTATRLSRLLDDADRADEWRDQIALAVLRLAYQPAAPKCVRYIQVALQNQRRAALPILAALCHVDVEACIALAAEYFGRAGQSDDFTEKHQGYIPAFVRNFIEVDDRLLRRLVERTKTINAASGKQLVQMLETYLDRPFFVKEVGHEKVAALREGISVL